MFDIPSKEWYWYQENGKEKVSNICPDDNLIWETECLKLSWNGAQKLYKHKKDYPVLRLIGNTFSLGFKTEETRIEFTELYTMKLLTRK